MRISNWFHHLFNPHCAECKEEREASRICLNCETLKHFLETEKREKQLLIEKLFPERKEEKSGPIDIKPIMPKNVPWSVRQQMLEQEDRDRAREMKKFERPIEELENLLSEDENASEIGKAI